LKSNKDSLEEKLKNVFDADCVHINPVFDVDFFEMVTIDEYGVLSYMRWDNN